MQTEKWLRDLLNSRGLERPDGRMLYSYRLNEGEYHALRDALESAMCRRRFNIDPPC